MVEGQRCASRARDSGHRNPLAHVILYHSGFRGGGDCAQQTWRDEDENGTKDVIELLRALRDLLKLTQEPTSVSHPVFTIQLPTTRPTYIRHCKASLNYLSLISSAQTQEVRH